MSLEPLEKGESKKKGSPLLSLTIFLIFLVLLGMLFLKFYEREKPQVVLLNEISRIGLSGEISLAAIDDKSGIRSFDVAIVQDNKEVPLHKKVFDRQGYFGRAGERRVEEVFTVNSRSLGLRDGIAEIVVRVRDFSWWNWMAGNVVVVKFPISLDTSPPKVSIIESPRYVKNGSAGVVMYRISEPVSEHGVMINNDFHPGFPLPRHGQDVYGATIGLQYDLEKIDRSFVKAVDLAGNGGMATFSMILRKSLLKSDRINISDSFLSAKLPEFALYYPELSGEPVEQYLKVNNDIRNQNYLKVREVCTKSQPDRLWEGKFNRLPRSSRRAGFADLRTYYYNGEKIDQQVHLGIDLASVRQADVEAANRGVVVYADYLGIYGNTVIVDHGQGIFSLYSHLSQISVALHDQVEKGAVLGKTGASGMAGGDHLHFSMLVNGIFVNPVEWWDEQWLKINILNVL